MYHGQLCGICKTVRILRPIGTVIYPVCRWCSAQLALNSQPDKECDDARRES